MFCSYDFMQVLTLLVLMYVVAVDKQLSPVTGVFDEPGSLVQECGNCNHSLAKGLLTIINPVTYSLFHITSCLTPCSSTSYYHLVAASKGKAKSSYCNGLCTCILQNEFIAGEKFKRM